MNYDYNHNNNNIEYKRERKLIYIHWKIMYIIGNIIVYNSCCAVI